MNIRRILFVFSLLLAIIGYSRDSTTEVTKTTTLSYHDQWRSLWEEHIGWTRSVIVFILDGPSNPDFATVAAYPYTVRLLQNPDDMANALRPYYNKADVDNFNALVRDHLVIAAQLLVAAKADPFDQATFDSINADWYENAEAIAALMAQMNPKYWPASMGEEMWESHLDATLTEAVSHLTGDANAEVAAVDMVHSMALTMADFFSAGVIGQFHGQFSGPK